MLRTNMGLPPLYTCLKCGIEIDPKSQSTLQIVKAWVKSGKKTIVRIEDEYPVYLHEHCLLTGIVTMDTLF
jgi:hypothetical protein